MMRFIFLSPHYDDVVFSCGGLIWELLAQLNNVEIWTVCGGNPDFDNLSPFAAHLHQRWGTALNAVHIRQKEDRKAAKILGVKIRSMPIPDCIYRHSDEGAFYYTTEDSLFGELDVREQVLVDRLASEIIHQIPAEVQLIAPLGVGNHVDHQLTRQAAQMACPNLWYYAEVPYILKDIEWHEKWLSGFRVALQIDLSAQALQYWGDAAFVYRSQISTFWQDENHLRMDLEYLIKQGEGGNLWCKDGELIHNVD